MFKATYRIRDIACAFVLVSAIMFADRYSALAQIAPGVQQSAAQTATITGTLLRDDRTPVIGANIELIGSATLTTRSDVHGTFYFTSVPYGMYRIIATAANLGTALRDNLIVKGDINVMIQYIAQNNTGGLKTIAQVSTHSAGAKINVTAASIASVNPNEYAFQGNSSWQQLLNQIPGVTVGGFLQGGNSSNAVIPGAPLQPIVLSIDGAMPYETSVTLDGMPLVNSSWADELPGSGTDLSYLPMPAFDTADVVRGPGANAPSIVNSIGGSFVLHAPGIADKNQLEFSASNDPYGGVVSNVKAALRFGRLSTTIVYGVNDSPGPLGTRSAITAVSFTPQTVNGQPFQSGGLIALVPNSTYGFNCGACSGIVDTLLYCCAPVNTTWTQHSGAIALSYAVTPSVTAQIFYAAASSTMGVPQYGATVDFAPGAGYTGSLAPGMHNYLWESTTQTITQASSLLEEKLTAYLGHGVLRLAALQDNSFNRALQTSLIPNGQYTVYGTGTYTNSNPAIFNGTSQSLTFTPFLLRSNYWTNNRSLLASYAIQLGSASTIGVSYVTSYYNDPYWYDEVYGMGNSQGSQSTAISETTNEIRIHAGTEVSNKLSFDASWYFALGSYHLVDPANPGNWINSDFRYNAPRFGAVWHANQNIQIRAAAGGGYALAPLEYLVGTNNVPFCTTTCSVSLTNLNLKPEESFGFDVGTDIRLHRNTVLAFDLYRTNLYGQFFQSTNLTGTYAGLPLYTNQEGNLSQSRYEGINVDISHDVPKGLYWHGALGLTRGYVVNVPAGFYDYPPYCTNCYNTYIVPGANFDGEFQLTVPYANGSAQIGYRWAPGKYIDFSPTYYGKGNPYFEPAFLEFDAHAGYPLTKNISLIAAFRNITGIYGQNYQNLVPSIAAPTVAGSPYPLFGIPYGPRTVIVTLNFKS